MANVRWHTMMSLDGFIAGPRDDMQLVVRRRRRRGRGRSRGRARDGCPAGRAAHPGRGGPPAARLTIDS